MSKSLYFPLMFARKILLLCNFIRIKILYYRKFLLSFKFEKDVQFDLLILYLMFATIRVFQNIFNGFEPWINLRCSGNKIWVLRNI